MEHALKTKNTDTTLPFPPKRGPTAIRENKNHYESKVLVIASKRRHAAISEAFDLWRWVRILVERGGLCVGVCCANSVKTKAKRPAVRGGLDSLPRA